ncbi:MAG: hypothetical protein JW787_07270 [Sedimentisphaerales bacterium]|nr:hypothetical protein [Sedimentisphaerales bacterium]
MRDKNKNPKELYLKVPYHILNLDGINLSEKMLLSHIYSYGVNGCWESNETLGITFMVDERSISRWVKNLKKNSLVYWVHPKGRYRTLWAKSHLEVKEAKELLYMGEKINKEAVINGHAAQILLGQNCRGGIDKTVVPTATKDVFQVRQICLHINNTTNKDIIERTIEQPPPLPAGGQAPAALAQRTQARQETIDNFKQKFGFGKMGTFTPMPDNQFQERVRQQRNALLELK